METDHMEQDLGTAAFLQVRGFRLLGLAPTGAGRYAFRFADPDGEASAASLAYLQGEAVAAYSLVAAEKSLKTFLYATKDGNVNGKRYGKNARNSRRP